jgi:hypothetical protein
MPGVSPGLVLGLTQQAPNAAETAANHDSRDGYPPWGSRKESTAKLAKGRENEESILKCAMLTLRLPLWHASRSFASLAVKSNRCVLQAKWNTAVSPVMEAGRLAWPGAGTDSASA